MPKARILIVEDNPIVAEDIRIKLARRGYTSLSVANNARKALESAERRVPDIALMDIHLGDEMIGIDTAIALKQKHQVPVIFITAYADEDTVERAKIAEPYGYILKPLDENELYSVLEIALYKQQADRSLKESQQWLQTTLRCIGDGVIATDRQGRVVFLNSVAETLTGWRRTEAIGLPLDEVFAIIHEETGHPIDNPVGQVLKEQHIVGLADHTLLKTREGRRIPIADSGAPIRNERGEIIGVVLVFRDQTKERLARRFVDVRLNLIEYATGHPLNALLTRALDEVGDFVLSPIGFYHFIAPDQKTIALQQWSTRTLKEFCRADGKGHTQYPVEQAGVWADCVASKKPIIHNDYASLPHKKGLPEGHAELIRELVVPVIREDKVVAILGVGNKPTDYTPRDVEIVSQMADITWEIISQKRAEQALRKSEEQYRGFVEDTPVLICRFKPDGTITFANQAYCEYFNRTPEELFGSTFLSLIPEEGRDAVMAEIKSLTAESPTRSHEHEVVAPNQKIRWQRWTNRALFDPQGQIAGYQSIGEDITEHRRAQGDLKRTLLEWQATFDAVNAAIWILDKDQRIVRSNKAVEQFCDHPYQGIIGKFCWEILHDERKPVLNCPLPQARKSLHRETMELELDDGWFEIAVDPILDDAGEYAGAVHIVTDITKRKHDELEKEKLQGQLIQSQKMESVGRLAGGVAHDFNNMLGVIIGHAELAMARAIPASQMHSDLQEILNAAQRSADLTRQLLAFARRQTAIPKVLDLNDTVSGMLKMLRRLIGEDIDLLWMPGAKLWPVRIDPAQVDQIVANLGVNARDAIQGVGKITIETKNVVIDEIYCADIPGLVPGAYVMLVVSDDGCGIGKEILDNIFEPFFTTKEAGRGTGLGLATVYGIVKQNSGFINAYSEPGHGATFKIYIPRTHMTAKPQEKTVVESDYRGAETVLVVEDEASILNLARMVLEKFGYTVLTAQTPAEARQMAENHPGAIELLITDVVMPEMNGKELTALISRIKPSIKTLFMSGYTSDVMLHHGILEGDVHFLQKPFSVNSLGAKVREVLD